MAKYPDDEIYSSFSGNCVIGVEETQNLRALQERLVRRAYVDKVAAPQSLVAHRLPDDQITLPNASINSQASGCAFAAFIKSGVSRLVV